MVYTCFVRLCREPYHRYYVGVLSIGTYYCSKENKQKHIILEVLGEEVHVDWHIFTVRGWGCLCSTCNMDKGKKGRFKYDTGVQSGRHRFNSRHLLTGNSNKTRGADESDEVRWVR